jgi:hypothetical protein
MEEAASGGCRAELRTDELEWGETGGEKDRGIGKKNKGHSGYPHSFIFYIILYIA